MNTNGLLMNGIEKIYIWGCGKYGRLQALYLEEANYKIESFIDNDITKDKCEIINGIFCYTPYEVVGKKALCIICVKEGNVNSIYKQAIDAGFSKISIADFECLDEYSKKMEDKKYLEMLWELKCGYTLNFDDVRTYCEKLQYLKLFNRRDEYTKMADKISVREYVKEKIKDDICVDIIQIWNDSGEIDFCSLPDKFVLKCNHDSGSYVICKDKNTFDYVKAIRKMENCLKRNYYYEFREWPYLNIQPKVFAEKYIEGENGTYPIDYKVHCFDGKPYFLTICVDRETRERDVYADVEKKLIDISDKPNYLNDGYVFPDDDIWDKLLEYAGILSEGIPYVRVDFIVAYRKIYFTEMTFFPSAGFDRDWKADFQLELGRKIQL